jgi:hypothetical protein
MSGIQQLLFSTKGQAGAMGVITLTDVVLQVTGVSSALQVGYQLNSDGFVYKSPNGLNAPFSFEQWVAPAGAAGQFEVYVTVINGGPVNGTINAWLPLTVSHQWYIQANTSINQFVAARIAVTVRRVGQTTPEDTAYIDMNSQRS